MGHRDNTAVSEARRRQRRFNLIVLAATGIIVIVVFAYTFESILPPPSVVLPYYLDKCIPVAGNPVYVSYPAIQILISGQPYTIPADIGVSKTCVRPINTRGNTGVIHVDAFEERLYTVQDFFLVWGATYGSVYAIFNRNQLFLYKTDAQHNITMTVNGQPNFAYETQQFPTNANVTSLPYNIIISYG